MREIKLALLEADVNYKVVKDFVAGLQEKMFGRRDSDVPHQASKLLRLSAMN